MQKHLPAQALIHRAEYHYNSYFAVQPEGHTLADAMDPRYWGHFKTLKQFDIIRLRAFDGSYDVMLTVVHPMQGAAVVEFWPKVPDMEPQPERHVEVKKVNGKTVPRVDHTKATKWRVIGLDGNEYSRGHETKEAAERDMGAYLQSLGLGSDAVNPAA